MPSGLLALLDDVAAISKVAAASLDDIAANAAKAGTKAAGIVIDDTAVTPRYVVGLTADRELPIIGKIAWGSLKNKLLLLLPGALGLSYFLPSGITPLLMAGGVYLCLEGYHKVAELLHAPEVEAEDETIALSAYELEHERVTSAIRTDLVLSAEIMAIALAAVAGSPMWMQAVALVVVGIGMTALVYGLVALIVKADDAGVALARTANGLLRLTGRGLVKGMPPLLEILSFVGMLAMLWVGGGIVFHGLHQLGVHGPEEALHRAGTSVAGSVGVARDAVAWLTQAALAGFAGLIIGAITARAVTAATRFRAGSLSGR